MRKTRHSKISWRSDQFGARPDWGKRTYYAKYVGRQDLKSKKESLSLPSNIKYYRITLAF